MDLKTALIAAVATLGGVVATLSGVIVYLWRDLRGVLDEQRLYYRRKNESLKPPNERDTLPPPAPMGRYGYTSSTQRKRRPSD